MKSKKKIYLLGNPVLDFDSLPVKLAPSLKKYFPGIEFIHLDPTENLPFSDNDELIFIDTVLYIDKITIFNDFLSFSSPPRNSVHDYDLLLDLSILKKLHKIKKFTIIGIPSQGNINNIADELKDVLKSNLL